MLQQASEELQPTMPTSVLLTWSREGFALSPTLNLFGMRGVKGLKRIWPRTYNLLNSRFKVLRLRMLLVGTFGLSGRGFWVENEL